MKHAKERYQRRAYKSSRKATIKEKREFIEQAKKAPCSDCGNTFHPVAMDFDHVRGEKVAGLSYMAEHGYGLDAIKAEIGKCELVCANCHRVRTWVTRRVSL